MSKYKTTFIFIRHAQSEKNTKDITGGKGERLTAEGVCQAKKLAKKLCSIVNGPNISLYCSNAIQVKQTAHEISREMGIDLIISKILSPARLGIIGGLSGSEIMVQYPEVYARFQAWKKKQLEAIDLNIPGMESPEQFWHRIIGFLNHARCNYINIVICTRSVMVLIANFVQGKHPQKGGGYTHVSVEHCASVAFDYYFNADCCQTDEGCHVSILNHLTTSSMGGWFDG